MTALRQQSERDKSPIRDGNAGHGGTESSETSKPAYRILIVDDNPSIHEDFGRILRSTAVNASELDELAASLLGVEQTLPAASVRLDSVYQGEDAFDAVRRANDEGQPYALVFMDIRMHPGWNGIETTARLFEIDDLIHVILCTAYADHEWRQRLEGLHSSDRILLLKKPFDPLEVRQLANAMCHKWTLAVRDRKRMEELERSISQQASELEAANEHLRKEIAERKRAERELRKAQRLEGLGRLAAGLCHEINNPLTFIVGSVEALDDILEDVYRVLPPDTREELDELLRTVSVGADRITHIVRNVKLLARQSDAEAEFVDVLASVDTAVELVRRSLGPHIELRLRLDRSLPMRIFGRRLELEQVLVNLLENAAQALAEYAGREARIDVVVRATESDRVQIVVADTGPGIPDKVVDKIFDPFFTTKPVNQGTGLGLSICHSLITGMNGAIEVESTMGEGTTFTVTMPAVSAELVERASQIEEPEPVVTPGPESRGRLLILDDEPFIRKILQRVLKDHDVTAVSNAHEALTLCMNRRFDLILSDIMMPGISGRDFYRMLGSARPGEEEKIVFITGGTLIDEVQDFLDSVSNLCLEKPVDPHVLRTLIAERMNQRSDGHG